MTIYSSIKFSLTSLFGIFAIGSSYQPSSLPQNHQISNPGTSVSRKGFLSHFGAALVVVNGIPGLAEAKSYSANARNFERLNSGDMSGGSLYDNNPTSEAGKRRRAITGCKNSVAREESSEAVLKAGSLSEKECNQMVLEGSSEFMLQALRNLECPSCPYGIKSSRI